MCNRFTRLKCKEVVNVCDGARLGFVCDLELDVCTGQVVSLVVPGTGNCFGLLGAPEEFVIPWACIRRIGDDIILVEGEREKFCLPKQRKPLF